MALIDCNSQVIVVVYGGKPKKKGDFTMQMQSLLIADGSEAFTNKLTELLRGSYHIRVCHDGQTTLAQLRERTPDLMILDLLLPELDGISLLHAAAAEGIAPHVLGLTRFSSDYVMESAERLGVSYLMMKPCEPEFVCSRLKDLSRYTRPDPLVQPDVRAMVSNVLLDLRIPTKLRGYVCAREAVLYLMRSPGMSVTKELYPAVAALCDGTPAQVERAIRGAIQAGWSVGSEYWDRYFIRHADGTIRKPSNAEFLSRIADALSLDREDCWEQTVLF